MPEILNSFTNWFNGIAHTISTITSVPTGNKNFERFSWTLKIIAQIIEIVLAIILLARDIIPNLHEIEGIALRNASSPSVHFDDQETYRDAANAYIILFALEIASDVAIWAFLAVKGPKKLSVAVSMFFSIFFELPIMSCILHMMKAQGTIDWDKQVLELLFQVWFFVNIMLQFTVGYAQKVAKKVHAVLCGSSIELNRGRYVPLLYMVVVIFLVSFSYLILCLLYAFVILPISGWNGFKSFSDYMENSHKFIHGTFRTSSHAHNMFDFLIFNGFVGQWIWTIIIVTIFLVGLGWSIGSLTRSVVCGCLKGIFDRSNQ